MNIRRLNLTIFLLSFLFVLGSCEGPEGPTGPAGPQGPIGPTGQTGATGPRGANGTNGTDGRDGTNGTNGTNGQDGQDAQITQYNYPAFDIDANDVTFSIPISYAETGESLILGYAELQSVNWYPIPGYVLSTFEYRTFTTGGSSGNTDYIMRRVQGTGTQSFTAFRILVVPVITITNGEAIGIDFGDYDATINYLNLAH